MTKCSAVNPQIVYTTVTSRISLTQSVVTSRHVNTKLRLLGVMTTRTCAEQLNALTQLCERASVAQNKPAPSTNKSQKKITPGFHKRLRTPVSRIGQNAW